MQEGHDISMPDEPIPIPPGGNFISVVVNKEQLQAFRVLTRLLYENGAIEHNDESDMFVLAGLALLRDFKTAQEFYAQKNQQTVRKHPREVLTNAITQLDELNDAVEEVDIR
jgi:hypothetical protein